MEPGPERIRQALVLSLVAGVVATAGVAIFVATMSHPDTLAVAVVGLLTSIAACCVVPIQWWQLVTGCMALGLGIGSSVSIHPLAVVPCLIITAVLFAVWGRRLRTRLLLFRSGERAPGRVVAAEGTYANEDTHVRISYSVRFVDAAGAEHTIEGRSSFAVGTQPRARDAVEVYYLPTSPTTATPVFTGGSAASR
ncbi:hypothetical protein QSJ18_04415 [Gordonia sp. ABSL1-1]|uniref:DUF3592 domain-containing protein n=1 Tax=Gordonia sp. ABSL1-1 TaxID=3053923 RepID=UPI0025747D06|nr:DUF3592 domain-containing protein [Gordonia sp. ABSL1-1]MDL9935982.1 hypothetical protein [Gordonia sp. ABSL1-1]